MRKEAAEEDRKAETEKDAPSDKGQNDGGERGNDAIPNCELVVSGASPLPPRRE